MKSLLLLLLVLISACTNADLGPDADFNQEIKLNGEEFILNLRSVEVDIVKSSDNTATFELSGPEKIINNIELILKDNKVELKEKLSKNFLATNTKVTGKIALPFETDLDINCLGSCDLNIDSIQSHLEVDVAGSGEIIATNSVFRDPDIQIAGSGNINIDRCKGDLSISISGSGDFHASRCEINSLDVGISGSGKIYIDAGSVNNADISISGSGELFVPKVQNEINQKISGSGKINFVDVKEQDLINTITLDIESTGIKKRIFIDENGKGTVSGVAKIDTDSNTPPKLPSGQVTNQAKYFLIKDLIVEADFFNMDENYLEEENTIKYALKADKDSVEKEVVCGNNCPESLLEIINIVIETWDKDEELN